MKRLMNNLIFINDRASRARLWKEKERERGEGWRLKSSECWKSNEVNRTGQKAEDDDK